MGQLLTAIIACHLQAVIGPTATLAALGIILGEPMQGGDYGDGALQQRPPEPTNTHFYYKQCMLITDAFMQANCNGPALNIGVQAPPLLFNNSTEAGRAPSDTICYGKPILDSQPAVTLVRITNTNRWEAVGSAILDAHRSGAVQLPALAMPRLKWQRVLHLAGIHTTILHQTRNSCRLYEHRQELTALRTRHGSWTKRSGISHAKAIAYAQKVAAALVDDA